MQEYSSKQALIEKINKTAALFIGEFSSIAENEKDLLIEGVDRTPAQIIAYQLGWMQLLLGWESDEQAGKPVITPAPAYKWNNLGGLYAQFYRTHAHKSLTELIDTFGAEVEHITRWLDILSPAELFESGARKWASSTPSAWPVWKWVHINTVAPFQSFRTKIRKWKKLRSAQG